MREHADVHARETEGLSSHDLRTRTRTYGMAACAYAVLTVLMAWPVTTLPRLGMGSYGGDALLNAWALAWNNHVQLSGSWMPYFDANIFHPAPDGLARSEHLFGISLVTLPVYALTRDALLAYDLAWLASFPACGLAMFALCGIVTRSAQARFVGGLVYAFAFFRFEHALHLQLLWGVGLPLTLLHLYRWWCSPSLPRVALWGLLLLLQCLSSWYLAVLCVVANGALFTWLAAATIISTRRHGPSSPQHDAAWPNLRQWLALAITTAIVAVVLYGFARPYLGHPPASTSELTANSATVAGYLVPPGATLPGLLLARGGVTLPPWSFESSNYLGVTALLLAASGLIAALRRGGSRSRHVAGFFAGLVVLSVLLSLGPRVVAPTATAGWSPFDALHALPGVGGFRVPARFALLVTVGVAVLCAAGVEALRPRIGSAAIWAAAALLLGEVAPIAYTLGRPPRVERPRIYAQLRQFPRGPVLSLPAFTTTPTDWFEAQYMLFATQHWYPIVNGYSRYVPAGHIERMQVMAGFPGPAALAELRRLQVRYVVTHTERFGVNLRPMIAEARNSSDLELLASTGTEYLWRVRDVE